MSLTLTFQPITSDDLEFLMNLRNSQLDILRHIEPVTMENQHRWFEEVVRPDQLSSKPKSKLYIILNNQERVGYGGLCYIDHESKKAELSFLLLPEILGKTEEMYITILCDFVKFLGKIFFKEMKFNRIHAETYQYRHKHLDALEKAGFKEEGVLRKHVWRNGSFVDSKMHGLLESDLALAETDAVHYNKDILVTGGAGLIGQELIKQLLTTDVCILYCVDLKPMPKSFRHWSDRITYLQKDYADITQEQFDDMNPSIIYHLAATFERTTESMEFLGENFHNNLLVGSTLTEHIINHLSEDPGSIQALVFASSYLIYDSNLYQKEIRYLNESDRIQPRNVCGASKLFHEVEFSKLKELGVSVKTPRIFRVFGPGECGKGGTIIHRWIKQLTEDSTSKLTVHRPNNTFDYIYSKDISRILMQLAAVDHTGIVNIGSGKSHTIMDVMEVLMKEFPLASYEIINDDKTPYEAEYSVADISLLNQIIHNLPSTTLEDGILECIKKAGNSKSPKSSTST